MGNRKTVGGVAYVLNSFLGMTSFVGVILLTAVLVTKLGQASKWRKKTTLGYHQHQSMSTRDQKTVKMIVLIATILIVCYSPSALISTAAFIIGNEFDIMGKYVNICSATWSLAFPVQAINSSVNIFLYYSMSSKYREALHEVFLNSSKLLNVK